MVTNIFIWVILSFSISLFLLILVNEFVKGNKKAMEFLNRCKLAKIMLKIFIWTPGLNAFVVAFLLFSFASIIGAGIVVLFFVSVYSIVKDGIKKLIELSSF